MQAGARETSGVDWDRHRGPVRCVNGVQSAIISSWGLCRSVNPQSPPACPVPDYGVAGRG